MIKDLGFLQLIKFVKLIITNVINFQASRGELMKLLWAYLKKNNLQCDDNKQYFVPDKKMAKVFGTEKLRGFAMSKHIGAHLLQSDGSAQPASKAKPAAKKVAKKAKKVAKKAKKVAKKAKKEESDEDDAADDSEEESPPPKKVAKKSDDKSSFEFWYQTIWEQENFMSKFR